MLKYFGLLFMFVLLCCVGCVYFAYLALLRMVRVALCASSARNNTHKNNLMQPSQARLPALSVRYQLNMHT
jgi:hypothetical protein